MARRTTTAKPAQEIVLPERIQLSERELAATARLVRILREPHNWVGFFIEWLLQVDASSPDESMSIKTAEAMLTSMKNMENWIAFLEDLKRKVPTIAHHRALAWIPEEEQAAADWDQEEQFQELVRMWRMEHPEPAERVHR